MYKLLFARQCSMLISNNVQQQKKNGQNNRTATGLDHSTYKLTGLYKLVDLFNQLEPL